MLERSELAAAAERFSDKWAALFHACPACGARVPSDATRREFVEEFNSFVALVSTVIDAACAPAGSAPVVEIPKPVGESREELVERDRAGETADLRQEFSGGWFTGLGGI